MKKLFILFLLFPLLLQAQYKVKEGSIAEIGVVYAVNREGPEDTGEHEEGVW